MKDSCINRNSIIHVAVVDDDNTFIERYTMMVDGFMKKNGLECSITCFADGNELIQNIDGSSDSLASFDLYCLDIEMPGMNGLELAGEIRRIKGDVPDITFVTSNDNAVYDVFKFKALGYVRKSLLEKDFEETMGRFVREWRNRTRLYEYESKEGIFTKTASEIIYGEVYGHNLRICCNDGSYKIKGTLSELAAMLKDEHFIQPYKGYLVNCQYIGFLKSRELTLKSGDVRTIPVSKYKWQEVKEEYMKYIKS